MAFKFLPQSETSDSRSPSKLDYFTDAMFRRCALGASALIIVLFVYIVLVLLVDAYPAIKSYGFGFLTGETWSSSRKEFGILPEIWGTLYSSLLALLIGGTVGIFIAIFLTQGFIGERFSVVFRTMIELLAAIPSVVYGLWGIYVVVPNIRPIANWLHTHFEHIPFFSTSMSGPSLAPAVIVLSIMILPTVAALSIDAFKSIPYKVKEAAYGMGATRWEAILKVMMPSASSGILAALVLAFGRALGETMALAMLIGNSNHISLSLFAPANTLASLIASNFPEAGEQEIQVLLYAAIVLLTLTLLVNIAGSLIQQHTMRKFEGSK